MAFEDACRTAAAWADAEEVASRLREALAMWRGHPYADIDAHGFLDGEITRLSELRLAALENRIDADLRAGRHREVIAELDALTVEHPFRENLRAMHMLALYRSGRQAEALRAFGHTRSALVEGLGIDPSPELKDLQRRILDQDRTLLAVAGPTVRRRAVVVADIDDFGWRDPAEREIAFARRESELASAAGGTDGVKLAPRGTAGYAIFDQPIHAVQAARQVVNERTRVAVDFGDLEMREDEPVGPPLARAARLVAVAHPGQVLLSPAAHQALTAAAGSGWAAESLGSFDIVGLDPGLPIYQLVGHGFGSDFPELLIDRLPPAVPGAVERSVPGYELRSVIGIGQLGEVHRAYQPSVGREVALRIFGPGIVGHPQFVRRFETASQRVTRVEHPHVVPLLDYWREPNRGVMVSRLMTGGHLGQRIPEGGMATDDALAIFETVASGIASAHRHGVAHGRIRPQNVLFDDEDNAFVADLGVDEICTGIITFATDAYDAPERLGGALATPAADVYSLGILLHHLLGGSPPPQDGTLSLGEDAVDIVVARATDPDPRRRQSSVDELVAELRDALTVPVDPTTVFVPTRNPYRGLAAFEQADADDFHGRERAVRQMVEVLEQERLLVVVGPSGIGKSSVVKAGLLPSARRRCARRFRDVAGHRDGARTVAVRAAGRGTRARRHGRASRRRRRAGGLGPVARRRRQASPSRRHRVGHRHRPVRGAVHPDHRRWRAAGLPEDDRGRRQRCAGRRPPRGDAAGRLLRPAARLPRRRRCHQGAHGGDRSDDRRRARRCRSAAGRREWASRSSRGWWIGSPPRPRCSPAPSRSCNTRWPSCSPGGRAT